MTIEDQLRRFLDRKPEIHDSAFVARSAKIIGAVTIGPKVSVWPFAVLRGDINSITIGEGSNIQDGSTVHLANEFSVTIGNYVTVGHGAIIHACTIGDECLIGMRSTIMDGAIVGHNSIIGAHALVTQGMVIPPGSLVLGSPGKVVKPLSKEEQADLKNWALKYVEVSQGYKKRGITL